MLGHTDYETTMLPAIAWDALAEANAALVDTCFECLQDLNDGVAFADTELAVYLPQRYLPRYNETFVQRFLVCVVSVGVKLRLDGVHPLACTGEELATQAMVLHAIGSLESDIADGRIDWASTSSVDDVFDRWTDVVFEDPDHELLFVNAMDGIEDAATGERLGLGYLRFDEWFTPFDPPRVVSPYLES